MNNLKQKLASIMASVMFLTNSGIVQAVEATNTLEWYEQLFGTDAEERSSVLVDQGAIGSLNYISVDYLQMIDELTKYTGTYVTLDTLGNFIVPYNTNTGNIAPISSYNEDSGNVYFIPLEEGIYSAKLNVKLFDDVSAGEFYAPSIAYVSSTKVMNGVTDTTFNGDGTITRAMLAQMLFNIFNAGDNIGYAGYGVPSFLDVNGSAWYAAPMFWAYNQGIITGDGFSLFPEEVLTRQEVAVIIARAYALEGMSYSSLEFTDNSEIDSWAMSSVNTLVELGIITGLTDGSFNPSAPITRSEMSIIVKRLHAVVIERHEELALEEYLAQLNANKPTSNSSSNSSGSSSNSGSNNTIEREPIDFSSDYGVSDEDSISFDVYTYDNIEKTNVTIPKDSSIEIFDLEGVLVGFVSSSAIGESVTLPKLDLDTYEWNFSYDYSEGVLVIKPVIKGYEEPTPEPTPEPEVDDKIEVNITDNIILDETVVITPTTGIFVTDNLGAQIEVQLSDTDGTIVVPEAPGVNDYYELEFNEEDDTLVVFLKTIINVYEGEELTFTLEHKYGKQVKVEKEYVSTEGEEATIMPVSTMSLLDGVVGNTNELEGIIVLAEYTPTESIDVYLPEEHTDWFAFKDETENNIIRSKSDMDTHITITDADGNILFDGIVSMDTVIDVYDNDGNLNTHTELDSLDEALVLPPLVEPATAWDYEFEDGVLVVKPKQEITIVNSDGSIKDTILINPGILVEILDRDGENPTELDIVAGVVTLPDILIGTDGWEIIVEDTKVTIIPTGVVEIVDIATILVEFVDPTLEVTGVVFTGFEIVPDISVSRMHEDGIVETLVQGTDYIVAFNNNVDIGTATVLVEGINLYRGSVTLDFEITTAPVDTLDIHFLDSVYTYSGDSIEPEVIVYDLTREISLQEGTDYTLDFLSNVEVGTGYVLVAGIGSYSSIVSAAFEITASTDISSLEIEILSDDKEFPYIYNGTAHTPSLVIIDTNTRETLIEDVDYVLNYTNNINVGTATTTVEFIKNYSGAAEVTFNIIANTEDVVNLTLEIKGSDFTYTGFEITPDVVLKDNNVLITEGYELSYFNNVNTGTATLVVTLDGNYAGVIERTFEIQSKAVEDLVIHIEDDIQIFNGYYIKPDVIVYDSYREETLVEGVDYALSFLSNRDVGEAYALVTGLGNYDSDLSAPFTIIQHSNTDELDFFIEFTEASFSGGTDIKPLVSLGLGEYVLEEDKDYNLEYFNNTNAGTATVVVTLIEGFSGSIEQSFDILPLNLETASVELLESWMLPDGDNVFYNGNDKFNEIGVVVTATDGSYTWIVDDINYSFELQEIINVGTYNITLVTESLNYVGENNFEIELVPFNGEFQVEAAIEDIYFTGDELEPDLVIKAGNTVLTEGVDYTVLFSDNVSAGTAIVDITGIGNYAGITGSQEFTILSQSVDNLQFAWDETLVFNGDELDPDITVMFGDIQLVKGVDYELSGDLNFSSSGSYEVDIELLGNYSGTKQVVITIAGLDMSSADVVITPSQFVFGDTIEFTRTLTLDINGTEVGLVEGIDYVVEYSTAVNIGEYRVSFKGIGNYIGEAVGHFNIIAYDFSTDLELDLVANVTYTGIAQEPEVVATVGDIILDQSDYTIEYSENVNVGTATVKVTGLGNYTGSIVETFDILPAGEDAVSFSIDVSEYIYDGTEKQPNVTVMFGAVELGEADYSVNYTSGANVGEYSVSVEGLGNFSFQLTEGYSIQPLDLSSISEFSEIADVDYDRYTQRPEFLVTVNGTELAGGDYTTSFANNIDVGTATITITGIGNYTGSAITEFNIVGQDLSEDNVTVTGIETVIFNGAIIEQPLVITWAGLPLADTDYSVVYADNINAGTATVVITFKGNYSGSLTRTFEIQPLALTSNSSISGVGDSYIFSGNQIVVSPIVTIDGVNLVGTALEGVVLGDTDYTVSIVDNVNVGTATVTILGIGNYTGSLSCTFDITTLDISGDVAVEYDTTTFIYTRAEIEPKPTITLDGEILTLGIDYSLGYEDNINVGIATSVINFIGNFDGEISGNFSITPADITELVAVTGTSNVIYTGNAFEPDIAVSADTLTLVEDEEYTVTFTENINVGTAYVTIGFIGNYTGEVTRTFSITAKAIEDATIVVEGIADTVFDGNAACPTPVVTVDGVVLGTDDYMVSYVNNINVGTAEVVISFISNYTGNITQTFDISQLDVSELAMVTAIEAQVFNGTEITPTVSVSVGNTPLVLGRDFSINVTDNINAGTANILITFIGNYNGAVNTTFSINPLDFTDLIEFDNILDQTFTGAAIYPNLSATVNEINLDGDDYVTSFAANTDVGVATITVTGVANYTGTASVAFDITARELDQTLVSIEGQTSFVYSSEEIIPELTITDNSINTTLVEGVDYNLTYNTIQDVGTEIVSIEFTGNYNGSASMDFEISPADISVVGSGTLSEYSYVYSGAKNTPELTVVAFDKTLDDSAFNVTIEGDTINKGQVVVTVSGVGNYTGALQLSYDIEACELTEVSVVEILNQTFSGNTITPTVIATFNDMGLNEDDYSVAYASNINVGTATVTLTGLGNYKGSVVVSFDILPFSLTGSNTTLSGIADEYANTGSAIEPIPIVFTQITNGTTLVKGTDYTVEYANNVVAGEATVIITGIGNYTGSVSRSFDINLISIIEGVFSSIEAQGYTGTIIEPDFTFTVSGNTLTQGTDFTVSFSNNVEEGTATITVTGTGLYTGTVSTTFEILSIDWSLYLDVSGIEEYYKYTGETIKPIPVLVLNGKTLVSGTDYNVYYEYDLDSRGVGTLTVILRGLGVYDGQSYEVSCIIHLGELLSGKDFSYLMTNDDLYGATKFVIGTSIDTSNASSQVYDVSAIGDNSIVVFKGNDNVLYMQSDVGSDGTIVAPIDASYLFAGLGYWHSDEGWYNEHFDEMVWDSELYNYPTALLSCYSIEGLVYLDTSVTENMQGMFNHSNFGSVNVSTFDTSNVTNMAEMFSYDYFTIEEVCANIVDMDSSLQGKSFTAYTGGIKTIYGLEDWDMRNVVGLEMFSYFWGVDYFEYDMSAENTRSIVGDISQWQLNSIEGVSFAFAGSTMSDSTYYGLVDKLMTKVSLWDFFYHAYYPTLDLDLSSYSTYHNDVPGFICSVFNTLNVDNLVTSSTGYEDISGLFSCLILVDRDIPLDLSSWDMSNINSIYGLFAGAGIGKVTGLSSWNLADGVNVEHVFGHGYSFTTENSGIDNEVIYNSSSGYGTVSGLIVRECDIDYVDLTNWDFTKLDVATGADNGYWWYNNFFYSVASYGESAEYDSAGMFGYTDRMIDKDTHASNVVTPLWNNHTKILVDTQEQKDYIVNNLGGIESNIEVDWNYYDINFYEMNGTIEIAISDEFTVELTKAFGGEFGEWSTGEPLPALPDISGVLEGYPYGYNVSFASFPSGVKIVDISNWDFTADGYGNAPYDVSLSGMFKGCTELTTVRGFNDKDLSGIGGLYFVFENCESLVSVDFTGTTFKDLAITTGMFRGCTSLEYVILDVMPVSPHPYDLFDGCIGVTAYVTEENLAAWNAVGFDPEEVVFRSMGVYDWNGYTSSDYYSVSSTGGLSLTSDFKTQVNKESGGSYLNWETGDPLPPIPDNATSLQDVFFSMSNVVSLDLTYWDTSNITDFYGLFLGCSNLTTLIGLDNWDVSSVTNMSAMFSGCSSITYLDIDNWNPTSVTNMYAMFSGCSSITYLDLGGWEVSSLADLAYAFYMCSNLTYLNLGGWGTSSLTTLENTFYACSNLTTLNVDGWDTRNVTTLLRTFRGCSNLLKISGIEYFDTSGVITMHSTFYGCESLKYLDLSTWNTGKVTTMYGMFYECYSLVEIKGLENFDVSKVTNIQHIFQDCTSLLDLTAIECWDVKSVITLANVFNGCSSITTLDLSNWVTSYNQSSIVQTFMGCTNLKYVNLSNWYMYMGVSVSSAFKDCVSLETIDISTWTCISDPSSVNYTFDNVPESCVVYVKTETLKDDWSSKFPSVTFTVK